MEFEEEGKEDWTGGRVRLGAGMEGDPAIGFLPVDLDNEFEIVLGPALQSKPPPSSWQDQLSDLSSSSVASVPVKDEDELMQVKTKPLLMNSSVKAGVKQTSGSKPTEFEAQILALLEDTDEQEDSDSDGELLYEPSNKASTGETPTFPSGKEINFQAFEAGKENSARQKPEKALESTLKTADFFLSKPPSQSPVILASKQSAVTQLPADKPADLFRPSPKAVEVALKGTTAKPAPIAPNISGNQTEAATFRPVEVSQFPSAEVSLSKPPYKPSVPATTSALMGLMVREVVKATPPSAPALNRSFRRHRFMREDRSSVPEELLEKMADEALAAFPVEAEVGVRPGHRKTESNPPPNLREVREEVKERPTIPRLALDQLKPPMESKIKPVLVQSEVSKPQTQLDTNVKPPPEPVKPPAEPTPLSSYSSVPSTSSLSTSSEPPVKSVAPKPSNPVQFQLHNKLSAKAQGKPAQPDPSPDRPRRLSNEFEEDAMGEAKEWLAFSANPELNDSEESEGDDEFSISAKGSVRLKVTAEKQFSSYVREESAGPTLQSVQLEKEKEAKGKEKKGKRVDLKTRKMMAEARLGEKQDNPPPVPKLIPEAAKPAVPKLLPEAVSKPVAPRPMSEARPVPVSEAVARPVPEKKEDRKAEKAGKREESKMDWLDQDGDIDLVIEDDIGPPIAPASTTSNSYSIPRPSLPAAQEDEWSKATALALEERSKPKEQLVTPLITHSQVWPVFEQMDIRTYREPPRKEEPQRVSWMSRCFRAAPVELEDNLKDQRDRIYALLHVAFNESPLHLQVLMSVWKFLTRSKEDCARLGHHWDRLGFQGADPATDLRSMGIFGLLQLLFLACYLPKEAEEILAYSRESGCNFPFAAVSLNMTKVTIEALREGKLNKLIISCGEAYRTVLAT